MSKTETPKTDKPKDLAVTVKSTINNVAKVLSFSASWNCGDDNYNWGQRLHWREVNSFTFPSKWGDIPAKNALGYSKENIDKNPITFAELNLNDYAPIGNKFLVWVRVWVRGRKGKYSKQKPDPKNKKKKITVKYEPKWSDWTDRLVRILPPPPPTDLKTTDGADQFTKTISWSVPATSEWASDASKFEEQVEVFYDTQYESILVNNNSETYSLDMWNSASSHAGYISGTTPAGATSGDDLSRTITEDTTGWTDNYSYTRYFRVQSRGPGGYSGWADGGWVYLYYTYANNTRLQATNSTLVPQADGSYALTFDNRNLAKDAVKYPVDYYSLQYLVEVPTTTITTTDHNGVVEIHPPADDSGSWTEVARVPDLTNITYPIESYQVNDKYVWSRTVAVRGSSEFKGVTTLVSQGVGRLSDPSNLSITDINLTTHRATVSATNNSAVAASYLAIYSRDTWDDGSERTAIIGILHHNESSVTVKLPTWLKSEFSIGVKAYLTSYSKDTSVNTWCSGLYTIAPPWMESNMVWDGGQIPLPPQRVAVEQLKDSTDSIRVTWDWTWTEANAAEISWSDQKTAWESTSQPSTYIVSNVNDGAWIIAGVGTGTWHVRVRLIKRTGDTETYGTYSAIKTVKIVSAPDRPNLVITPSVIPPDGSVKLTWVYSSEDGVGQKTAQIARSNSLNRPLRKQINSENSVTLTKNDVQWSDNELVKLKLRVESKEGQLSEWSSEAKFQVAPKPAIPIITFTQGWVNNKTLTFDRVTTQEDCVVSTPLKFNISGVGKNDRITVSIFRAEGSIVKRPDETEYPVYSGDIAYLRSDIRGNASVTINQNDLRDYLEDGHRYIIQFVNTDQYGQSTEGIYRPFRVVWNHQAVMPTANIVVNQDEYTATITPIKPSTTGTNGYMAGDTCDIYRLSVDKPELIVASAEFDKSYFDPYPTIGEFGGYQVVYKTFNGDYRVKIDNKYAITVYDDYEYTIDDFISIIDFNGVSIPLRYNLSMSNSWKKDFSETKYLGGSIQGDWNPGVSRSGSLSVTVSIQEDPLSDDPGEIIRNMRRLAVYPGMCHVRTPDGSSYYANIDVSEDREEKWVTRLAKFSLNITRVDSPIDFENLSSTDEDEEE